MDNNIKSVTNYNGEVIDQTSWIEKNYHVNLGGDKSGKEPKQMPNVGRQPINRVPFIHPKEKAATAKEKADADKVKAANKKDLRAKNIT